MPRPCSQLALVVLVVLSSACDLVPPSNPFDPAAPRDVQAKATLKLTVVTAAVPGEESPGISAATASLAAKDGSGAIVSVETGDTGDATFTDVVPGAHRLQVVHPGFFRHDAEVVLGPGEARDAVVALVPLPSQASAEAGHLTGQVHKSGELLREEAARDHSGIVVEVEGAGLRTVTNVEGTFDLFLAPGSYALVFSARDHQPTRREGLEVTAGATTTMPDGPVVLAPNPGSVAGSARLADVADAAGHGGILITIGDRTTTTSPDGSYRVTGLPAGTYSVTASFDDHDPASAAGIVVQGGGESTAPPLSLRFSTGAVRGRVQLAGRSDHSGVHVELTGTTRTAQTNTAGDFSIAGAPVGVYELTARRTGFVRGVVSSVTVAADAVVDVAPILLAAQQGDFDIDQGAAFTADRDVVLGLSADNAVEMRVAEDPSFAGVAFVPFEQTPTFTLSEGDGQKTVHVQYRDAAGLAGPVFSASIVLDTAPPSPVGVLVNDGRPFTNDASGIVSLRLSASDATSGVREVRLSSDGVFDSEPWQPFVESLTFPLGEADVDGEKTISAHFRDHAGNETASPAADAIVLDRQAPVVTAFTIDCGGVVDAPACASPLVALSIAGTGASFMALSNDPGFAVEVYEPFATARAFFLLPGDGEKAVFVKLQDQAGNVSTASFDEVLLDTVAPATPSVVLAGGAAYVRTGVGVPVAVAAADAASMRLSVDGALDAEPWVPLLAQTTIDLPAGDGPREVLAQVRDVAGNLSPVNDAQVIVDGSPPVVASVVVGDGSGYVRSADGSTAVAVICQDALAPAGALALRVQDGAQQTLYSGAYVEVVPVGLGATEGARSLVARCTDPAGNGASAPPASVVVDHTPPAVTSFILNGGTADERTASPSVVATYALGETVSGGAVAAISDRTFNCATASYDFGASGSASFTLSGGDGTHRLFLCARDAAGNITSSAVASTNAVVLDTTPPSTPDLARTSLTESSVGLTWTRPSEADLQGYVLERRIEGEVGFAVIASPGAATTSFSDAVAAGELGLSRSYRVLARDGLGNRSAYSIEVNAGAPFLPVATASYQRTTTTSFRQLSWTLPPGTSEVSATYFYEDAVSDFIVQGDAATNVTGLTIPAPTGRVNEVLLLRTTNADESLTWETELRFGSERRPLDESRFSGSYSIAVDEAGVAHVAYQDIFDGGLVYLALDGSSPIYLDQAGFSGQHAAIALTKGGVPFVAYQGELNTMRLVVVDDACRADPPAACAGFDLDVSGSVSAIDVVMDAEDRLHVAYRRGGMRYLRVDAACLANAPSACSPLVVEPGLSTGLSPSIALDRSGVPHLAWADGEAATRGLDYVRLDGTNAIKTLVSGVTVSDVNVGLTGGALSPFVVYQSAGRLEAVVLNSLLCPTPPTDCDRLVIDGDPSVGFAASMEVDGAGEAHVAYQDLSNEDLRYAFVSRSCLLGGLVDCADIQVIDAVGRVGEEAHLALGGDGAVHIAYRDKSVGEVLSYAKLDRLMRAVEVNVLATIASPAAAVDGDGLGRVGFTVSGELRLLSDTRVPRVLTLDTGVSGAPGIALDAAGRAHLAYHRGGDLKYVVGDGASAPVVLDAVGTVGRFTDLALDAAGVAHVTYFDDTNSTVKYVRNDGSAPVVLDPRAGVAGGTGVAVDAADAPHAAWARFDAAAGTTSLHLRDLSSSAAPLLLDVWSGGGGSVDLAAGADGALHVAWVAVGADGVDQIRALRVDAACRANAPADCDVAVLGGGSTPSIVVDDAHVAHVAWHEQRTNQLFYKKLDGASRLQLVEATHADERPTAALGPAGEPRLYFVDFSDRLRRLRGEFAQSLPATRVQRNP